MVLASSASPAGSASVSPTSTAGAGVRVVTRPVPAVVWRAALPASAFVFLGFLPPACVVIGDTTVSNKSHTEYVLIVSVLRNELQVLLKVLLKGLYACMLTQLEAKAHTIEIGKTIIACQLLLYVGLISKLITLPLVCTAVIVNLSESLTDWVFHISIR